MKQITLCQNSMAGIKAIYRSGVLVYESESAKGAGNLSKKCEIDEGGEQWSKV